jgi:prepilin-type N-terminal cleavage/methylation domain-containing protein
MHKRDGFTIIEILIAIIIAGFILLVVFLAVPATQRTARNSTRHKDASAVLASVLSYRAENKTGSLPESCDNIDSDCFTRQVGMGYYDNQASTATVSFKKLDHPYSDDDAILHADDSDSVEQVALYSYALCNDSGTQAIGTYASPQNVVVVYAIETINGAALQCKAV